MSRRTKIQFQQWIILTLAWEFMAVWINVYDHLTLHTSLANGPAEDYSFFSNLLINCGGALIGALLGGTFLVFYVNTRLADKSYGYTIFIVTMTVVIVMTVITLVLSYFYVTKIMGIPVSDHSFGNHYRNYALDPLNFRDTMMWGTITAITQFVFQMNTKFGQSSLWKIVTGRYRRPKEEKRIFMFVDLNSSTTIAEQLGPENYHRLLKDFFAHITNPIIDNDGEIYQYVGDEVIIAWNYEKGIANNRCIQCFYEMKSEIEKNKEYYQKMYDLVPLFKAGIHYGKVIAGEIGIIKRDITFSGDVLNTTSRIQNKCKEFKVDILASSELLHSLILPSRFTIRELGSIELRGKEKRIELSTLLSA